MIYCKDWQELDCTIQKLKEKGYSIIRYSQGSENYVEVLQDKVKI